MIKQYKRQIIISSLLVLSPILPGVLLWNQLPAQMPMHWGGDGAVDGYGSKLFGVIGVPLLLFGLHWLCILLGMLDRKNHEQNPKAFGIIFWVCPVISVIASGSVYSISLGGKIPAWSMTQIMLGLLLILIGNYLPKCKHNRTLGVRVKWTLANEENWNATHRMAGKTYVAAGFLMMVTAFLPEQWLIAVMLFVVAPIVMLPVLYSYLYYKKQVRGGADPSLFTPQLGKGARIISICCAVLLVIFLIVLNVTGKVSVECGESAFTVSSTYWQGMTVSYDEVETVEYRDARNAGFRINGFGSPKLSVGLFRNEEFGDYFRYTYTQCDACIVVRGAGNVLVISGKDAAQTQEIYQYLMQMID